MENWVSLPLVAAQINCQRVMSNARVAPSTLLSKAELIQLNTVPMMTSVLTHEGLAAAGEEHCSVRRQLVSLKSQISIRVTCYRSP